MSRYLVSGVSRGIGRATAEQLTSAGHEVFGLCRTSVSLAESITELGLAGGAAADLRHPADLAAELLPLVAEILQRGGLDGLVHAAGIIRHGAIRDSDPREFSEQLTVNVTAAAELTRLWLPALRERTGTLVFVNSGSGRIARSELAGYSASKFALRAFADALREEEPALRVSTLYPGPTATDMQRDLRERQGLPFQAADYLLAETVAGVIVAMLTLPRDGVITELSLRPKGSRLAAASPPD
jgi:NAD(P)-dependent dehydrogenase (short-subunit alcohol dehydrogenase family)